MAQTAGASCVLLTIGDHPKQIHFPTIDKAKFRKPVVSGDTIEYHVPKTAERKCVFLARRRRGRRSPRSVGAMVA
jgi:3-hydroxyacyl-[acyl-carrier-protein] dehydratase